MIARHQSKIVDSKLTVKLKHAKKTCDETFKALVTENEASSKMSANALEGVAKGRYVLTLIAYYIHECFIDRGSNWKDLDVQREFVSLLESAEQLCTKAPSRTPQLYLLKQLTRRYGLDCARTLDRFKEVQWILPPEALQQVNELLQQCKQLFPFVHG